MAIDIEIVELLVNGKTLRIEVAANLYNMVGELDEVKTDFPLYTPISESVTSIVRALLPLDWRPPTQRQLSYATTMAKGLGLRLQENALRDTTVCSEFIASHEEAYSTAKEEKRAAKEEEKRLNKANKNKPAVTNTKTSLPPSMP